MSSKTKIVVLRMKEIIYTAIFVGLAILLITLCSGLGRTTFPFPLNLPATCRAYTARH